MVVTNEQNTTIQAQMREMLTDQGSLRNEQSEASARLNAKLKKLITEVTAQSNALETVQNVQKEMRDRVSRQVDWQISHIRTMTDAMAQIDTRQNNSGGDISSDTTESTVPKERCEPQHLDLTAIVAGHSDLLKQPIFANQGDAKHSNTHQGSSSTPVDQSVNVTKYTILPDSRCTDELTCGME